ncbi:MAG: hypothetical protein DCC73_04050 [Proteobacteria bacterium]|nr:MAG: hypothetical protein DCC73_04050 [Pseudomonadota bacterium]
MSRLHTSFVLAYHGCDQKIGEQILTGKATFKKSEEDYDWLGPGVYFWESDPHRAREWAEDKKRRGILKKPFVIGAAIDLGHCLDLMSREDLSLLKKAYDSLREIHEKDSKLGPLPTNSGGDDRFMRRLDCAVIKRLHYIIAANENLQPYDTVRGLFTEGNPLFPGSGFQERSHIQIAVCNFDSIKGVFRVKQSS